MYAMLPGEGEKKKASRQGICQGCSRELLLRQKCPDPAEHRHLSHAAEAASQQGAQGWNQWGKWHILLAQSFPPLQGVEGIVAAHFIFLIQYLLQRKKESWVWILFSYRKHQISMCTCYVTVRIEQQLCQPEVPHETLPKHKSIDADGLRHEGKWNWVVTEMQRLPSWFIPLTSPQTHNQALRYLPRDEWKSHFMIHFKLDWTDHCEM